MAQRDMCRFLRCFVRPHVVEDTLIRGTSDISASDFALTVLTVWILDDAGPMDNYTRGHLFINADVHPQIYSPFSKQRRSSHSTTANLSAQCTFLAVSEDTGKYSNSPSVVSCLAGLYLTLPVFRPAFAAFPSPSFFLVELPEGYSAVHFHPLPAPENFLPQGRPARIRRSARVLSCREEPSPVAIDLNEGSRAAGASGVVQEVERLSPCYCFGRLQRRRTIQ
ncbi:hypothetical protein C8R45DRAFT_1104334 [Mycena sanguinolenta]|nr:hypothetical protein C8R45DRAFT_1104334 [Mycena sanguinolenta]